VSVEEVAGAAPAGPVCPACSTGNRPGARFCRNCGAPLKTATGPAPTPEATVPPAGQQGEPLPPVPAPALPRLAARRRLILLAAVVVAILVIGGGLYLMQPSPKGPVKELFAAMAARDYPRMAELLRSTAPLMRPEAWREGYTPPTGATITGVSYDRLPDEQTKRPNKSAATVHVRYKLAGQWREGGIGLDRDYDGMFRSWDITAGAAGYFDVIHPHIKTVRVAAASVPTIPGPRAARDAVGELRAPIGLYAIGIPTDDPLFTAEPVTIEVSGGYMAPVELRPTVKPAVAETVDRQVRTHLDECARQTTIRPARCPMAISGFVFPDPTDAVWKIDKYPRIELRPAENAYLTGGPVEVRTVEKGRATCTYTRRDTLTTESVDFKIDGAVALNDRGEAVWSG